VVETQETPTDRAGRYLRMADRIRNLAWAASEPTAKEACLDLAMQWTFLANETRRRRPANDS
jgi:hypothetical protein